MSGPPRPRPDTAAAVLGLLGALVGAVGVAVLAVAVVVVRARARGELDDDLPPGILFGVPAVLTAGLGVGGVRLLQGLGRRVLAAVTALLALLALTVAVRAIGDSAPRAVAALVLCLASAAVLGCTLHPSTGRWLTGRRAAVRSGRRPG